MMRSVVGQGAAVGLFVLLAAAATALPGCVEPEFCEPPDLGVDPLSSFPEGFGGFGGSTTFFLAEPNGVIPVFSCSGDGVIATIDDSAYNVGVVDGPGAGDLPFRDAVNVARPAGGAGAVIDDDGVVFVVFSDNTCDDSALNGTLSVELVGGAGRSYDPSAPEDLFEDTQTELVLNAASPQFLLLPDLEGDTAITIEVGDDVDQLLVGSGDVDDAGELVCDAPPCSIGSVVDVDGALRVIVPQGTPLFWIAAPGQGTCPVVTISATLNDAPLVEDCGQAGDEDGDGAFDCDDDDCAAAPACDEGGDCPVAVAAEVVEVMLVDTTEMLSNFVCFEDRCGDEAARFFDDLSSVGGNIPFGYSSPFAVPGVSLPSNTSLTVRQYNGADLVAERGSAQCVGDAFPNVSVEIDVPDLSAVAGTPLVIMGGLRPTSFGPPLQFRDDADCLGGDCAPFLPKLHVFPGDCETESGVVKLRVVNLSPDTASLSVSLDQLPDGGVISIAEGVAYGEASAYVGFGPSAQDVLAGTWSFVDDDIGEVDSVFVDFANVARSSAERPVTGTCNTIVFAQDDTFEQGVRPFLIAENPQLCSHWRNSSDGVQPSFWPSCD